MVLKGQVAVVTGASGGIGLAVAEKLAKLGAQVVITGRNAQTLDKAAKIHANIQAWALDVAQPSEVIALVESLQNRFGRLDILVNNAGMAPASPLAQQSLEEFDAVFQINVRAVVDLARQALPLLKANGGRIINISSALAHRTMPTMAVYAASKAALNALTTSWAKELALDGVRVNAVSAGPTNTPIYDRIPLAPEDLLAYKAGVAAQVPMGYFAEAEDIAAAVAFLATDESRYITGAILSVDGGFAI